MSIRTAAISADRTAAVSASSDGSGLLALATIAVALARHTDRSLLTLGYAASAGERPQPVAIELGDDPTFEELLSRARQATLSVSGSDWVAPEQGYDAVVALDSEPTSEIGWTLWLRVRPGKDRLELTLYDGSEEPDEHGTERLLDHVCVLLEAVQTDGSSAISALDMLSAPELEQLLTEWNRTLAEYPNRCWHELFEEQARSTPRATAVACGDERLTYAELDARSNQLAHHLIELGVGADLLVGIAVERSCAMLVGLLGILKAGGAYVPVDPAYPAERQAFMLESSGARVVVTLETLTESLPLDGVDVVCLDRDWPSIASRPDHAPAVSCEPEQLAYVIYTSGSTGQPKGVQIPHRALVNFLVTMSREPGLTREDVLVAVTTLSFDIAGLELYLPLLVGAQVVIAPAPSTSDPRALAELLRTSAATVMQATPTTWRMLLDGGWRPEAAMKALCGGEPLPVSLADRLVAAGLELWNMYGPTETTIWSTCARVATEGEALAIGRPIANTTIYILDRHLRPVPVGVGGELWIGGDGLARGYRGRPDLTEERFVPDPFAAAEGARMYRTGDLARYRHDGQIEFLGRIDNQVKVRGFRIELGEIETVLARHPKISEAVVIPYGADTAEAELAAYVIPAGEPASALELREYAGRSLPGYMIPSTVTSLERFPLTPNGKIDRKALPEPSRERSADQELVAPRSELEAKLQRIWERELSLSPIGVTDDFFDLGVTSIVAATLFAAIEHELGGQLPLGAIFRASTIESLAKLLQESSATSRWTSLIPIQPNGTRTPIFCVHGGAGTILHLAPLARRLGDDQAFYGLQSRGLYGGSPPLRTVEEMASHYLSEMRQVHPGGPWRLAGYCFGTIVAFEIAQQLTAAGEEVELLAMFNGPSPKWIKRWGWHGNQPSWQGRYTRKSADERRVEAAEVRRTRIRRAFTNPRRLWTGLMWELREPRARLALALGRPVPEQLRERFFLDLHQKAERAYEPVPFPGEIMVFYGEGLYEDPSLGWDGSAIDLATFAVPGEHDNNRQAMMEPGVATVAEHLAERLTRLDDARPSAAPGPAPGPTPGPAPGPTPGPTPGPEPGEQ